MGGKSDLGKSFEHSQYTKKEVVYLEIVGLLSSFM